MAKNHYTAGTTQLGKDTFIVSGMVVTRSYPRREGVVGGVAQVYKDSDGKVIGYTIADVKVVAAARKKAETTPEPALTKALDSIAKLPLKTLIAPEPTPDNVNAFIQQLHKCASALDVAAGNLRILGDHPHAELCANNADAAWRLLSPHFK